MQDANTATSSTASIATESSSSSDPPHPFQEKWPEARDLDSFLSEFVLNWSAQSLELCVPNNLFVIPSPQIPKLKRYNRGCRQCLKSLLMDSIKQWVKGNRNVLALGFGYGEHCGTTHMIQRSLNSAVDHWLTADMVKLHKVLGDDVMRYLWSHYIFLALDDSSNARQIAGPLFLNKRQHTKKRRRRRKLQDVSNDDVQLKQVGPRKKKRKVDAVPKRLQPHTCLYRKPLFYNNMHTQHVGVDLPSTPHKLYSDMMAGEEGASEPSEQALELCSTILRNHRKLDYHRLLNKCCPLPKHYQELSLSQLATQGISETDYVVNLCVRIVEQLLPVDFWGHKQNQSNFLKHTLPTILRLRRNERFPNQALMHGIRVTYFQWLSEDQKTRRHHGRWYLRVLTVLRWLVQSYLFVFLQRTFYITETQFRHQAVCHYRKPVWVLFRSKSLDQLLSSQYEWVSSSAVPHTPYFQSELRLVPKETGVRPIALQKETNKKLAPTFAVLNHTITYKGAGMEGLHELYPKYRSFLASGKGKLYFASVDIRHCFDNIRTDRLFELVSERIRQHPEYVLQKYFAVRKSAKLRTHVGTPEQLEPFPTIAQDVQQEGRILVDLSRQTVVQTDAVLEEINTLLEKHVLLVKGRYNGRFLLQTRGVPQGSTLSCLLCNLYYADVERRLRLHYPGSMLVRMIDDFMLVSNERSHIASFLGTMAVGDPEIGVEINQEKTRTSETSDRFFSWCGLRFETKTGQVRIDFSKLPLHECLRVEHGSHPGHALEQQVVGFCRPRCLPILFDPAFNTLETRCINYYQVLAFAAVRTAYYMKDLMGAQNCAVPNPSFVARALDRAVTFAFTTITKRLEVHKAEADFLCLKKCQWLGFTAWLDVLANVQQLRSISDILTSKRRGLFVSQETAALLGGCAGAARVDMVLHQMVSGL